MFVPHQPEKTPTAEHRSNPETFTLIDNLPLALHS